MNPEEFVKSALRDLAGRDRVLEAPAHVEARVRAAYRHRMRAAAWRRAAWWAAAAAAVIVTVALTTARRPSPMPAPVAATKPPEAVAPPIAAQVVEAPAPAPSRRVRPATQRKEVTTAFLPLLEGGYAAPIERGQIVRVRLPMSAMRVVGLPVREDRIEERVQADVLMGEDGVARAIRFVNFRQ